MSFIYLYRYIKAEKERKPKEEDREKLIIPITNLIQDILDITSKSVKNKEMILMLQERVKTYSERIRDEAIEEGIEKLVKNMLGKSMR